MNSAIKESLRHAYKVGMADYEVHGKELCPFQSASGQANERTAYFDGWYDAKHCDRLGRVNIAWDMRTQAHWKGGKPEEVVDHE